MRIKEIIIKKLFGTFDYIIPLNLDERITIIHAPNGFGKTNILKMIYGLFNKNYSIFRSIPFEYFEVMLEDGRSIRVDSEYISQQYIFDSSEDNEMPNRKRNTGIKINIKDRNNSTIESYPFIYPTTDEYDSQKIIALIDRMIPELERIGPREWLYLPTGETLSFDDVIERFPDVTDDSNVYKKSPKLSDLANVGFIETQRLHEFITERNSPYLSYRKRNIIVLTVSKFAGELKKNIREKLAEYATLSQSLDRTFPARLLKEMGKQNNSNLASDQISDELGKLETRRKELRELGILDKDMDMSFSIPETTSEYTKEVLTIYLQDMKEKLSVFDELANKISLLRKIITKKFQYKGIIFSKNFGFQFVSSDGENLPLDALSSGEQHESVLLYQLLFKTKPDSLILIDEPEISLHVSWQREFLKDLEEIAKLVKLDFILATHSPSIINDRWDLTVRLRNEETNE